MRCDHLDSIHVTELPQPLAGCEECLKTGGWWVHLRMCLQCGKVGRRPLTNERHPAVLVVQW